MLNLIFICLFLVGSQLIENWHGLPGANFVMAYNYLIWAVFCGVIAFAYPIVAYRTNVRRVPYWIAGSFRLIILLILSLVIDFIIYRHRHPLEFFEISLQATFYFLALPSIVVSFICASISGVLWQRRKSESPRTPR